MAVTQRSDPAKKISMKVRTQRAQINMEEAQSTTLTNADIYKEKVDILVNVFTILE